MSYGQSFGVGDTLGTGIEIVGNLLFATVHVVTHLPQLDFAYAFYQKVDSLFASLRMERVLEKPS